MQYASGFDDGLTDKAVLTDRALSEMGAPFWLFSLRFDSSNEPGGNIGLARVFAVALTPNPSPLGIYPYQLSGWDFAFSVIQLAV